MEGTLHNWMYIIYIYLLILLKIFYIVSLVLIRVEKSPNKNIVKLNKESKNLVLIMLALLMLYLFHPKRTSGVFVQGETKILLFIFGIFSLIDLQWTYAYKQFKLKSKTSITQKQFSLGMGVLFTSIVSLVVMYIS